MKCFTQEDRAQIKDLGVPHVKRPLPVYLLRWDEEFVVQTNEGVMSGRPGDFVAYDPLSGHIWPIQKGYVEQHYKRLEHVDADS